MVYCFLKHKNNVCIYMKLLQQKKIDIIHIAHNKIYERSICKLSMKLNLLLKNQRIRDILRILFYFLGKVFFPFFRGAFFLRLSYGCILSLLKLFGGFGGDGRGALGGVGTLDVGGSSGVHSDSLTAAKPNSNTDHDGAPKDECEEACFTPVRW